MATECNEVFSSDEPRQYRMNIQWDESQIRNC
jgi:hypothetical protein